MSGRCRGGAGGNVDVAGAVLIVVTSLTRDFLPSSWACTTDHLGLGDVYRNHRRVLEPDVPVHSRTARHLYLRDARGGA